MPANSSTEWYKDILHAIKRFGLPVLVKSGGLIKISFKVNIVKWGHPILILLDDKEPDTCKAMKVHDKEEDELDNLKRLQSYRGRGYHFQVVF